MKAPIGALMLAMCAPAAPAQARQASVTDAPPSRAQQLMGDVAPRLAALTDDVLLGDVWERPGLARRDRSLITVAALIALNRPDQLRSHIRLARQNGVTEEELAETITQLAFYAGWPNAITAVSVARDIFREAGAHTAWHAHPLGQHWDRPIQAIRPGGVVWIPPGVKHWHGASPNEGMTHIAIAEAQDGQSVEWMEKLSSDQYPD